MVSLWGSNNNKRAREEVEEELTSKKSKLSSPGYPSIDKAGSEETIVASIEILDGEDEPTRAQLQAENEELEDRVEIYLNKISSIEGDYDRLEHLFEETKKHYQVQTNEMVRRDETLKALSNEAIEKGINQRQLRTENATLRADRVERDARIHARDGTITQNEERNEKLKLQNQDL